MYALLLAAVVLYPGYSDRPVDADGWIHFTPSADTRIRYVSTSGNNATAQYYTPNDGAIGDDPYNPTGTVHAYATLAVAMSGVRSGYPDWVLLKRGDTWYERLTIYPNGRSAAQPFLLGAYGSGPRPVLKAGNNTFSSKWNSWQYAAFVGLYVYAHTRDPNSPEYLYSANSGRGFNFYAGSGQSIHGITIEDCVIRFFDTGIVIQGSGNNYDYVIRRNLILDCYNTPNSEGHSCGFYCSHAEIFLEDNVFDHDGWLIQGVPPSTDDSDGKATMYSHNTYFNACDNTVFRGNIFARGSSMGNKWRADNTGDSDHIRIDNNLYFEGEIGVGIGGNSDAALRFVDVQLTSNVFTDCGTSRPTGRTLGWNIEMDDWDGGLVADNLVINQTNPVVNNVYGLHMTASSTRNVTLERNTFHGLSTSGYQGILDRQSGMTGIKYRANEWQSQVYGEVLIDADSNLGGYSFESNIYYSTRSQSQWFRIGGSYQQLSYWQSTFGETGAQSKKLAYPYPQRTVYTYLSDLGYSNGVDGFIGLLRNQSHGNWDTNLTAYAINDYLRRGFAWLRMTTHTLPNGQIGVSYNCALESYGGTSNQWWDLAAGTLPDGLTISSNGVIVGIPTVTTSTVVTVRVQDSAGGLDQHNCSLVIVPEPAALAMLASALMLFLRRARHTAGLTGA